MHRNFHAIRLTGKGNNREKLTAIILFAYNIQVNFCVYKCIMDCLPCYYLRFFVAPLAIFIIIFTFLSIGLYLYYSICTTRKVCNRNFRFLYFSVATIYICQLNEKYEKNRISFLV